MKLEYDRIHFDFETFIAVNKENTMQFLSNEEETTKNSNKFQKSIQEIELCSEYISVYSKKLDRCYKYSIDQNSDPELLLKIKRGASLKSFKFDIIWRDPNGNCLFYFFIFNNSFNHNFK
jgi:hypothetical protein